jgi:FAD:protein FMN transferase
MLHQVEFRAMGCRMLALLSLPMGVSYSFTGRSERKNMSSGQDDANAEGSLPLYQIEKIGPFLSEETDAAGLEQVPLYFEEVEQALSRFQPDSELQRLNRSGGLPFAASDVLLDALESALESAEETEGLVHPLLLDAMEAAGYDASFEAMRKDGPAVNRSVAAAPHWRMIGLDRRRQTVQLPAGSRLDLGGSAKGWAADRALDNLSAFGSALVDAGGDIAARGLRADGTPWPVSVENPWDAEHPLCLLALCGGGLATSGRDYRVWRRGGETQHHIIDPRTGKPARTDVLTATVAAPSARKAEAAAKAVLIQGADAGMRWVEERDELAALLILENGDFRISARMRDMVWEEMLA